MGKLTQLAGGKAPRQVTSTFWRRMTGLGNYPPTVKNQSFYTRQPLNYSNPQQHWPIG